LSDVLGKFEFVGSEVEFVVGFLMEVEIERVS
jgi:hypothetical protein